MTKNSIITDYTYNDNNQLLTETIDSDTTITYDYDNNGNLITKTQEANTTLYTWDWRNMLVQVTSSQSPVTSYEYDGDGNRISKTAAGIETKYINDVGLPLVQVLIEVTSGDTTYYTYGNDLISMNNEQLSTNNYYHYDGLDSVRQMTDDTETVVASYTYDAFGNLIASTGTTDNTYGFTGEQYDSSSGLLYLRARYYDSNTGRFISRDPIGSAGGINLYGYCKNNPVNRKDPFGLWSEEYPDPWVSPKDLFCRGTKGCEAVYDCLIKSTTAKAYACEGARMNCQVNCHKYYQDYYNQCTNYCLGKKTECVMK